MLFHAYATAADPATDRMVAKLRAFCVAADLGSMARAAVALQVSQPPSQSACARWRHSPVSSSLTARGRA